MNVKQIATAGRLARWEDMAPGAILQVAGRVGTVERVSGALVFRKGGSPNGWFAQADVRDGQVQLLQPVRVAPPVVPDAEIAARMRTHDAKRAAEDKAAWSKKLRGFQRSDHSSLSGAGAVACGMRSLNRFWKR